MDSASINRMNRSVNDAQAMKSGYRVEPGWAYVAAERAPRLR
jgi:hypothetical protein